MVQIPILMYISGYSLKKILGRIVLTLLSMVPLASGAQILQDSSAMDLVKKGIGHIYNFQFTDAEKIFKTINTKYPGQPVTYIYKAMSIYYENYPLVPGSPKSKIFEAQLWTSIRVCEEDKAWEDDPEKLLIDLCARGMLMLFYTENEMNREVISMTPATYRGIMKSFQFNSVYPDFNCFTGIYNYYREAYPEHHPVYKAIAFLFPAGDKGKGLKELQYAAKNSIVLKAEAVSILSWICIHYENDFLNAFNYSKSIYDSFPSNLYFKAEYIKNLFLLKRYNEAEQVITISPDENNIYFRGQLSIFKGLIQEKKYRNYDLAEKFYKEGIDNLTSFNARGKEFADYGYKGLQRIKNLKDGRRAEKKKNEKSSDEVDLG